MVGRRRRRRRGRKEGYADMALKLALDLRDEMSPESVYWLQQDLCDGEHPGHHLSVSRSYLY